MREGFPLWSMASMVAEGLEPLRDWICLSVSRFQILPFHHFLNSRRSVTPIGLNFGHGLYLDITFLAAEEGHQPPYRVVTRAKGAPLASWPPRASSHVDSSSQKSHIFQKKSPAIFITFGFRFIWIFCEAKNMQQTRPGTGHWINMLVPKIV